MASHATAPRTGKIEKRFRRMQIILSILLLLILGGGGLTLLLATSSIDLTTMFVAAFAVGIGLLFFFVIAFRGDRLRRFNFGRDKHGRKLGWPDDRW